MTRFVALLLISLPLWANDYAETYSKTAAQYLLLYESSIRPGILESYLNECAESLKKAAQYGEPDADVVDRLRRYLKYQKGNPLTPKDKGQIRRYREATEGILDSLK